MDEAGSALWDSVERAQDAWAAPVVPGTLYGAEAIDRPDVIVWAPDLLSLRALREAGYRQTVALVPEGRQDIFAPLRDHAKMLAAAGRFVIAGGEPDFVAELARRLGRHRVWRAVWPEGFSDAAEAMHTLGADAVRAAIEGAQAYPIEGIYYATPQTMLAHRHAPPPVTLTTGCSATDSIMRLPGEGKLVLLTGVPNSGKSSWLLHVMAHCALRHDRRWVVFSPESGAWQHLAAQIMTWRAGKPFRTTGNIAGMTDGEIAEGAAWSAERFTFLACDAEDAAPTLDWLLDRVRACVLRDGATDFVIDPWNELEHTLGGDPETAYLGRVLQRLRAFCERHGVGCWIVAHPTKMRPAKPGEPVPVPGPYDIAGSANWANKADMILAVHCPDTVTQIHLHKARFRRWGRRGAVAHLEFDPVTGRFRSAEVAAAYDDAAPARESD